MAVSHGFGMHLFCCFRVGQVLLRLCTTPSDGLLKINLFHVWVDS